MKFLVYVFMFVCFKVNGQQVSFDKQFFVNNKMSGSYFYSEVQYQSPSWVKNIRNRIPSDAHTFYTPGNALLVHYNSAEGGFWHADILYHKIRGVDHFTSATQLVFRMLIPAMIPDSAMPLIAVSSGSDSFSQYLPLQKYLHEKSLNRWVKIAIPLKDFGIDERPGQINRIRFQQQSADNRDHILYLDQIELLADEKPADISIMKPTLTSAKAYERHVDLTWKAVTDPSIKYIKIYRSGNGKEFYPVGIQSPWFNRYSDFSDTIHKKFFYKITFLNPEYEESGFSEVLSATTHSMSDSALLDMVQEANFRYYWEGAEKHSGMALEDIPGRHDMIATGASGFGIMALIAGTERKFITRKQAVNRFDNITSFLMKAEKFRGAFPHFIDGNTGKVVPFFGKKDNGGDLVETSFLMEGLLCARQYFKEDNHQEKLIRQRIDSLWKGVEWDWYRKTPDSKYLYWHWSPDQGWVINHRLIGWNETMITYILAICSPSHPVPASMYYSGWASQEEFAQHYRENWSRSSDGNHYINGKTYFGVPLTVGVSDGGPLFFTHYSFMGLDPHFMNDAYTNYFSNNRNIALINFRYCVENPENHKGYGEDAWGLTASDGPLEYSADEPTLHADHGKITPTGALSSFPYLPKKAMDALKNYYRNYGKFLWGAYGFYDSFSPDENWCSEIFMGLNQAPITVMIENYRTGLLWKLMMSCPEVQSGLAQLKSVRPVHKD